MMQKRLTTKEVARMAGVCDRTVRTWKAEGKGPPYTQFGERGRILYDEQDVLDWLDSQKVHPGSNGHQ